MTERDALSVLASRFPSIFLDLWSKRPNAFEHTIWAKPYAYFLGPAELEQIVPGLTGICPLLEQNGEAIIGWLPQRDVYVRYYYEDGNKGDAAIEVLGKNYQQFVLALLLQLADAGLIEELADLGRQLQFQHVDELVALLTEEPFDEADLEALRRRIGPH